LVEIELEQALEVEQEGGSGEEVISRSSLIESDPDTGGKDNEDREDDGKSEIPSLAQSDRPGFKTFLFDVLETLLLTIVIYAVLSTVIGRYKVLSVSMEPTLYEGQYLLISKQTHKIWPLRRGDIIVFQYPRDTTKNYIKRIAGLPGEKIELRSGKLYVNGELVPETWISGQTGGSFAPRQLGEDEYFVMGDNRNNSSDSRAWGPIKNWHIAGKAIFRYWPFQSFGPIQNGPKPTVEHTVSTPFESVLISPLPVGTSP